MFHAMFHVRGTNFFTQKNTKTRALWGPRPLPWPVPQSWWVLTNLTPRAPYWCIGAPLWCKRTNLVQRRSEYSLTSRISECLLTCCTILVRPKWVLTYSQVSEYSLTSRLLIKWLLTAPHWCSKLVAANRSDSAPIWCIGVCDVSVC